MLYTMTMKKMKSKIIPALFIILLITGCGSGHVSMGGRVTYSDNGQPLEQGTVSFQTETFQARGEITADGRYTIGSLGSTDGLPPGTYQVFITGSEDIEIDGDGMAIRTTHRIEPKFASPDTSDLTVTVDGSTRQFDFQVNRYAPPPRR